MDNSDFYQLIKRLLPKGECWTIEPERDFDQLLKVIAMTFHRVQNKIDNLKTEFIPSQNESNYWNSFIRYFSKESIPTNQYIAGILNNFGYSDVHIVDCTPAKVGRYQVGRPIYGEKWRLWIQVQIPKLKVNPFKIGNGVGQPLATWSSKEIEELVHKIRPSHLGVHFSYGKEVKFQ